MLFDNSPVELELATTNFLSVNFCKFYYRAHSSCANFGAHYSVFASLIFLKISLVDRREIIAISESGQLQSFEFPKMVGEEMLKPQRLFDQRLHPNIRTAYMADINKDGLDELIVLMTDRVGMALTYTLCLYALENSIFSLFKKWFTGFHVSFTCTIPLP